MTTSKPSQAMLQLRRGNMPWTNIALVQTDNTVADGRMRMAVELLCSIDLQLQARVFPVGLGYVEPIATFSYVTGWTTTAAGANGGHP